MSQFKYTLPSGDVFVVNGPSGATQAEADRIFYEQVAAGSLVGYTAGQSLISPFNQIIKFELDRQTRGTAAVQDPVILAINQGLSTSGTVSAAVGTVLEAVQNLPRPESMPDLSNVEIVNGIDEADIVLVKGDSLGPDSVGPLTSYQMQKLLAQIVNLVSQPYDQISSTKGIGKYGFNCYVLEQIGYVKPGTSQRYLLDTPEDFVAVMSSPSVWTGKNGVYSLEDLLNDPEIQNFMQVELMQHGYQSLTASGTIVVPQQPSVKLSSGQVYTGNSLQSISALTLLGTAQVAAIKNLSTSATAADRLSKLLGASLPNLSTIASGAISNLTAGVSNLGNLANVNFTQLATSLTNRITGDVGALVSNASKFGSQATALWAKAGNVDISALGNNITGSLSNLTSNLDLYGKASQFATNFANPLSSLGNLGNLGNFNVGSLISGGGFGGALGGFGGGGDLVSGTQVAGGFNNTVNRKTVDAAFARIVGSNKVPVPNYEYPGFSVISSRLDIAQAQTILSGRNSSENRVFGQGVTI